MLELASCHKGLCTKRAAPDGERDRRHDEATHDADRHEEDVADHGGGGV